MRYKFVELSAVTDETIEKAVNTWVAQGWQLDGIRFVVTDASRRPSMAFVSFVRDTCEAEQPAAAAPEADRPLSEPVLPMELDRAQAALPPWPDEPSDDFPDPSGEVRMLDLDPEPGAEPGGGEPGA